MHVDGHYGSCRRKRAAVFFTNASVAIFAVVRIAYFVESFIKQLAILRRFVERSAGKLVRNLPRNDSREDVTNLTTKTSTRKNP